MIYEEYLHLDKTFDAKEYLIATYYLETQNPDDFKRVAGGVAAESSIGTWTALSTENKERFNKLSAKVFVADEKTGIVKIAYPLDLFEFGSLPQFLSSLGGNVFGLKDVKNLRWLDFEAPEEYIKSFSGPAFGVNGIRDYYQIHERPLLGSIMKPKLGLGYKEHAKIAADIFEAGIDYIKDDENLTSQKFNPFDLRVEEILKLKKEVEQKTGRKKLYLFNVTAPYEEMKRRANFVKEHGGKAIMIDVLTAGFSALQQIRDLNLGLIIHGHRAGHAAFTRNPKHGITNLVVAKLIRLAGVDEFHAGTIVGKMEGNTSDVETVYQFLRSSWVNQKPVLPIASGGLHPGMMPALVMAFGNDFGMTFGGGLHGHPNGSVAGAKAICEGLEAIQMGEDYETYLKNRNLDKIFLDEAIEEWGEI